MDGGRLSSLSTALKLSVTSGVVVLVDGAVLGADVGVEVGVEVGVDVGVEVGFDEGVDVGVGVEVVCETGAVVDESSAAAGATTAMSDMPTAMVTAVRAARVLFMMFGFSLGEGISGTRTRATLNGAGGTTFDRRVTIVS
jgi:hypothetical protein